ncbi:MAG TPA: RNA 2',3'-cyclic phosphodiesterase [Pyrinomonadaceae bacterium]|nr:RNA 2',3'-cyclic phosphodiesterase [Pyrinomonadaceae bacterium]
MKKDEGTTSSIPPSLRVFIAIKLPEAVLSRAAAHLESLRASARDVRISWQRAENLHLTLKFLGEIELTKIPALSRALTRAAEQSQQFKLTIEGAGAFPPRGLPRVLWLGVTDSAGSLGRLQKRIEEECSLEGFEREERPFSPHLTLARVRAPQGARSLAGLHREKGFDAVEFEVDEIYIMRSELGPGGSRYTVLSHHELGSAPQV